MSFNKTIVASFVSAALGTITLGVAANDFQTSPSLENILAKKINKTNSAATKSGMQNQFDKDLGKTTFQWARPDMARPDMGVIAADKQVAYAGEFYLNKLTGYSTRKLGTSNVVLANVHDQGKGAKIAKFKQEVAGVEVFNREYNILMDAEFNFVASSGYFASTKTANKIPMVGSAFGDASIAIKSAFSAMGGDSKSVELTKSNIFGDYVTYSTKNISETSQLIGQPRAKRVMFEHKGELVPAHYVEVEKASVDGVDSTHFSYVISAKDSKVLFEKNLVSHATEFNYRVYADENGYPWDSPHGNVIPAPQGQDPDLWMTAEYLPVPMVSMVHGPISTEDPWLADDATTTSGNNVFAYLDAIAPQGFSNGDYTAEITSTNTFDYAYNPAEAEYSMHNRKAAIVNLFYLNNYLHDDYYGHGFDEASGNAQVSNYDRGGVEGDPLNVEVQDYSGFNNANMSTPADGYSPRMQMYLWDKAFAANGESYGITASNTELGVDGLLQTSVPAGFGPSEYSEISAMLVEIVDGTDPARDGCEEATNADALSGKIAVIDRGACAFVQKVRNAQNAGAVAVIVANNRDGDDAFIMGGSDFDDITIPSMMISQNEGATVYAAMAEGDVTVNMFSESVERAFKASSFDNGTIAHEWGHYISNRLVGNASGLSSSQARSMGEGFGDFHALLLLSEEDDNLLAGNEHYGLGYSDSPYIRSFVYGIRPYPYSTNMEVNPQKFANVANYPDQVHAPGSIFATMLWDSFVSMINDERHTFAEAQSLMKDYLVAGYKMMPMAPTFTEGRDAILAAAYANDVEDYNLILAAFARRGMGLGAESPSRFSTDYAGIVESYETELSAFTVSEHDLNVDYEGLASGYCSLDGILDKGETGTVSFTLQNIGSEALSDLTGRVEVVSGHDVTFANDGVVSFSELGFMSSVTSEPLEFILNEAGTAEELELKLVFDDVTEDLLTPADYELSTIVNLDFKARPVAGNQSTDSMEDFSLFKNWDENVVSGGDLAIGTQDYDNGGNVGFFASFGYDLGSQTMYLANNEFQSDVSVETGSFQVGFDGNFSMSFWHFYGIEEGYDGGVVEISINGGDWVDVTAEEVGGEFYMGYNGPVETQPNQALSERDVFHGRNIDPDTGAWGNMESINFGTALNGNEVKLRFRISTDGAASDFGWWIDNVTFTNITSSVFNELVAGDTFACDNRLPSITSISDTIAVNEGGTVNLAVEGSDPNGDELTYSWTQTGGIEVTMAGADTGNVSFTAPQVTGNQSLEFTAFVNDGTDSVSQTVTVNVKDTTVAVTPERPKRHGGSTTWLSLLLLPLLALRRRK